MSQQYSTLLVSLLSFLFGTFVWWIRDRDKARDADAVAAKAEAVLKTKLDALEVRIPDLIRAGVAESREILIDKLQNGLGAAIVKTVASDLKNLRADFDAFMSNYRSGIRHSVTEGIRNAKDEDSRKESPS